MKSIFILLAHLAFSLADPQVFRLNQYNSNTGEVTLEAETGGELYLASSDDVALLKNIQITIGTTKTTLDQLGNGVASKITGDLRIKSANNEVVTADITGFLYVTSAQQANDDTFSVTVVNGVQSLSRTGTWSTTVVLNTNFNYAFPPFDVPDKTTYVTDVMQPESTDMNFHHDVPPNNWTVETVNQFFENPQMILNFDENMNLLPKTRVFFSKVEPLQINFPYWYITANGPYSMTLDNRYMNEHLHNTTTDNATGLFVINDVFQDQTVYFTNLDMTKKRWTGTLITAQMKYLTSINFLNDGSGSSIQSYNDKVVLIHGQTVTDFAATQMFINSSAIHPGTLYCQYFVFSGDTLPTTTPTPSTATTTTEFVSTTTVATTTKSSRSHEYIVLSILALILNVL